MAQCSQCDATYVLPLSPVQQTYPIVASIGCSHLLLEFDIGRGTARTHTGARAPVCAPAGPGPSAAQVKSEPSRGSAWSTIGLFDAHASDLIYIAKF